MKKQPRQEVSYTYPMVISMGAGLGAFMWFQSGLRGKDPLAQSHTVFPMSFLDPHVQSHIPPPGFSVLASVVDKTSSSFPFPSRTHESALSDPFANSKLSYPARLFTFTSPFSPSRHHRRPPIPLSSNLMGSLS